MNKQDIILMYIRDRKSKRCISRETGFARKTVDKYINDYEAELKELGIDYNDDVKRQELISRLTDKPKYKSSPRVRKVATEELVDRIKFFLDENKTKRLTGLSKQQKKKKDIYEELISEGFKVSYPTVSRVINRIEYKVQEAYIKQEYLPGDVVEFDWGTVKLKTEGGILRQYQMAVFTSAYSNYRWAKLFPKQTSQYFIEAHSDFFEYIGGSFATVVYDNMKTAVKKFTSLTEKEPTEDLLKLSLYYRFNFRFCNIRSGNEKGHVERSVEVVRRKAFSHKDSFQSLDDANKYLQSICEKINDIKAANKEIAHHKKSPSQHQWIIELNHYFTTLQRKPHALINSCAFKQIDKSIAQIYNMYFKNKEKDFIELLQLIGDVGLDKVQRSISVIKKITPTSVSLDKIKFVCQRNNEADFYNEYLNSKSDIVDNSMNLLRNYTEMLSERKDGMQ